MSQTEKRVHQEAVGTWLPSPQKQEETGSFHFPQVPLQKIPSLSPPPLNICPLMTSPLQTARCKLSRHSTPMWRAKSLSMVTFHLENNGNFTTSPPLPHICQERGTGNAERPQEKEKGISREIPWLTENETQIGISSIICRWMKIYQGGHYYSENGL